jgi:hypothetical protein
MTCSLDLRDDDFAVTANRADLALADVRGG